MNLDLIISINVHENLEERIKQIKNIDKYVKLNYIIIYNCNDFMLKEMKKIKNEKIIINPIAINKRRFHGSLTEGIYSNMLYAMNNYKFKYFLVLSSRNLFYNELKLNNLGKYKIKSYSIPNSKNFDINSWNWPNLKKSLLFKHYRNKKVGVSAHEGLMFNFNNCLKIKDFFEKNNVIKRDLFNFNGCVEEFAFQSICLNNKDENNNFFYDVGNGVDYNLKAKGKIVYKKKDFKNIEHFNNISHYKIEIINILIIILIALILKIKCRV